VTHEDGVTGGGAVSDTDVDGVGGLDVERLGALEAEEDIAGHDPSADRLIAA
jgi:hypothetical protein